MPKLDFKVDQYHILVNIPKNAPMGSPIVYVLAGDNGEPLVMEDILLVQISGFDWNRDLSPYPVRKVFKDGEDFGGGADDFLAVLITRLIPEIECRLPIIPDKHYIAGYSLAGLMAVYSLFRTNVFRGAACVSGSLWYDGFDRFMEQNDVSPLVENVYFSVGDKEKNTRNERMACVEERMYKAEARFKELGVFTKAELNPGNHFADHAARMEKGIRWLLTC